MKKMSKKLAIGKDTLRELTAELGRIVGGVPATQSPRCITNVITRC